MNAGLWERLYPSGTWRVTDARLYALDELRERAYWDTTAPQDLAAQTKVGFYADHGRRTCSKMLRRYLTRQLGYAA